MMRSYCSCRSREPELGPRRRLGSTDFEMELLLKLDELTLMDSIERHTIWLRASS